MPYQFPTQGLFDELEPFFDTTGVQLKTKAMNKRQLKIITILFISFFINNSPLGQKNFRKHSFIRKHAMFSYSMLA